MSQTGQGTSSTSQAASSISYILSITDAALADYTTITGIDLSKETFATSLDEANSSEAILQLLQERAKALKDYRDGDRRLIGCLSPTLNVIQAFSRFLGERLSLVSFPLSKALFVGIDVLIAAASGVTASYDALLDLFEHLGFILKRLEIYTMIPLTSTMTEVMVKVMVELLSVLAQVTKQIKQSRFKKFAKKLLGDHRVEAGLQRLDRLTQEKTWMAQTSGVIMEAGKTSTDSENFRGNLVMHREISNETKKTRREQLQKDVQKWLSPSDPSTNQNLFSAARHSGTTAWFFESMTLTEWKASGSILWVHGKPGTGKSTLLSAIIQDVELMHAAGLATMAYYYFDFRDVKKQDCEGLLSSLILQLSAESDSCYNILSRLYSDNSRGIRSPSISALKKGLKDMLSLPGQASIYIIVDALDECPKFPGRPSAREKVLDLIEELVSLRLPNLHLCVASRPEIDIRIVLEPLTSFEISLQDEIGQQTDIFQYIKSVVHSDRRMRKWRKEDQNLVIDTLSEYAQGMFRWVVCQLDRLRHTSLANIRSVLKDLPEGLDGTYEHTLLGIDEENREYAHRLFQCLSVSLRPLRVEELAEIFAVQFDSTVPPFFNEDFRPADAEEAVLLACSSLVTVVNSGESRIVQFSHFSVKEYLTSERLATAEERLSYYHILPEAAHTLLAHISLSVLLQLDDKIDRNTIAHFPLVPYAARYWGDHAKFKDVSSHIQAVMERLFDPTKPHFAAWIWLYDIDRYWTEPMSSTHPTRPEATPLYYASLCGFGRLVEHLIVAHSQDVNARGGSHTTPLHAASVKGHIDVATLLLESGADPNSRDDMGRVSLHRVSQGGQAESLLETARVIVNSGANVNIADDKGGTPLHAAAHRGYCEIAKLLLESGASLDDPNEDQDMPLHLACFNGKHDMAKFLLDHGSEINSRDEQGWIPLHAASRCGHIDVARLLIDRGADVSAQQEDRWTPLHLASRYGYLDVALLLIDRGADVDAQKEDGWTPLHLASGGGHVDIAKLLIDRGANVNSQNDKWETPLALASWNGHLDVARFLIAMSAAVSTPDKEGDTPLHQAAYQGHLHVTKLLLECGTDVHIRNGYGQTPLYFASGNGKVDVVRFLIVHRGNIIIGDMNTLNPLHIASLKGHLDVVQLMINAGTPVDVLNGTQKTPLALASSEGKVQVGRFLIERGADMNARDDQSWTPIHFASRCGHLGMVQLLLDYGVDPNVLDDELWSPLHLASANGHLKIAELLLQGGASVNVFNDKQETPLYRAVTNGSAAIARLLIDHGAAVHTADSNGYTVLHAASRRGHLGVVKLLLQRGADVDVLNKAGGSASESAWEDGHVEVAKFIAEYREDANTRDRLRSTTLDTLEYGADDEGEDEAKVSLHAAAEEGNIDTVKMLIERGVDINAHNASDQTPLHRAAAEGNVDVARLLIERGAEVDSRDKWGWTPLHRSSRLGHLEVLRVLLDHGANANARKRDYWTPMHISAGNGYLEIVKLLLERDTDTYAINGEGETPYQVSLRTGNREIADLLQKLGGGGLGESP